MTDDDLDTPHATPVAPEADNVLELDGEKSGAVTRSEFNLVVATVKSHETRLSGCETDRRDLKTTTGQHGKVIEEFLELKKQRDVEMNEMRNGISAMTIKLTENNELQGASNKLKVEALDEQRALRADFNSAAKVFIRMVIAEMVKPKFVIAGVLGGLLFGFIAAAGQAFIAWVNK